MGQPAEVSTKVGLPGIASRSRMQTGLPAEASAKAGEIATLLTVLTLLIIGLGTVFSTNETLRQNLEGYIPAAQSQCLQSTVKVKLNSQNGPVLTDAQMGNPATWGVSNDTDSQQAPRHKFSELPGNTAQHTFSFSPTAPTTNRAVKLFYDLNRYQIENTWCTDLSGSQSNSTINPNSLNPNAGSGELNGCAGVRPSKSDTIRGFTVACGAHVDYGWILKVRETPLPTATPTSAPSGPGDMEVKVVTLDWPQKTNYFRGERPASCTRNPSDERPLYLSTFTIDATNTQTGQKYSASAHEHEGHVSFHRIPAGQYNLAIRGIGGRGFLMWEGCSNKLWTVTSGGTVATGKHTLAYVALQNEARGIYETETNETQCTTKIHDESRQRGASNLIEGISEGGNSFCYYGTKKSTGPGGCDGPGLSCSGSSSCPQGSTRIGWCSAGNLNNNACCERGTAPQPTSVGGSSCGSTCNYSQVVGGLTKCFSGNCLDGSSNCSLNTNCGFVNGCSSGRQVTCPGHTPVPITSLTPTPPQTLCEREGNVCASTLLCSAEGGRNVGVRGCTNNKVCCSGIAPTSVPKGTRTTIVTINGNPSLRAERLSTNFIAVDADYKTIWQRSKQERVDTKRIEVVGIPATLPPGGKYIFIAYFVDSQGRPTNQMSNSCDTQSDQCVSTSFIPAVTFTVGRINTRLIQCEIDGNVCTSTDLCSAEGGRNIGTRGCPASRICCQAIAPTDRPTPFPTPVASNLCEREGNVCASTLLCSAEGGRNIGTRGCPASRICCQAIAPTDRPTAAPTIFQTPQCELDGNLCTSESLCSANNGSNIGKHGCTNREICCKGIGNTSPAPSPTPYNIDNKILHIIFNPYIPEQGKTLHEVFSYWPDPETSANNLLANLNRIPDSNTKSRIVETINSNEFPLNRSIQDRNLVACLFNLNKRDCRCQSSVHNQGSCSSACFGGTAGDRCDVAETGKYGEHAGCKGCIVSNSITDSEYIALFDKYKVCEKVNSDQIDELWLTLYPYSGVGESDMVGPNPHKLNGRVIKYDKCKKNVPIIGIDPNTGYIEDQRAGQDMAAIQAQHSLGHRIEGTMRYVYGSNSYPPRQNPQHNNWDLFTLTKASRSSPAACGVVHYPPNTDSNYSTDEDQSFPSYCSAFNNYPDLSNRETRDINCEEWGCSDEGFYNYWFDHIPNKPGRGPDGKLNNWWIYVFDQEQARLDSETEKMKALDMNNDQSINTLDYAGLLKNYGGKIDNISTDVAPGNDNLINALDLSKALQHMGKSFVAPTPHVHPATDFIKN